MNTKLERTLRTMTEQGRNPGAAAIWQRAVNDASPRRRRRRRTLIVSTTTIAVALLIAAVAVMRPSSDKHVTVGPAPATVASGPTASSSTPTSLAALNPSAAGIVYATGAANARSIVVVQASGSVRRLSIAGDAEEPVWSPNHRRIAFVWDGSLAIMNADGTDARSLDQTTIFPPAWSPDGRQLVFAASPPGGSNGGSLKVINDDGSGLRTVTTVFSGAPTWAPEPTDIAFTALGEPLHISRVNVTTGAVTRLTSGPGVEQSWPAWSPDGQHIAFSVNPGAQPNAGGIYVMSRTGTDIRRLTNNSSDFGAAWSPNGTRIAFVRMVSGVEQLFTVDIQKGAVTQLTTDSNGVGGGPSW